MGLVGVEIMSSLCCVPAVVELLLTFVSLNDSIFAVVSDATGRVFCVLVISSSCAQKRLILLLAVDLYGSRGLVFFSNVRAMQLDGDVEGLKTVYSYRTPDGN